ncbi:MAG: hypothetical protein OXQ29_19710 [Rhodospirillaceae bacterium]|nr:hypothetical protein [Rhodospirillaceae bacterium]
MLTEWSGRDIVYLSPAVVMAGLILLFSWLGPMGVTGETYYEMTLWGLSYVVLGVVLRAAVRWRDTQRTPVSLNFLESVPLWAWVAFAAGHGVIAGAVLALALQFDFTVMMTGGALVAAPAGMLLHKGVTERTERTEHKGSP